VNADLSPGRVVRLAPGVRRVVAPNPGMMTGPGTNTYILGERELGVIDPGPAIASHIAAILGAVDASVRWVFVTHTHPDHSPGAAMLADRCGAELIGKPPPAAGPQDRTFRPDRSPADGEVFRSAEFELEVLHTPGHASNHVCYRHGATRWLFTGDHIINGSTVVIDPPDGNMSDYLQSLERLGRLDCAAIAPGHGDVLPDPATAIASLVRHRMGREARVLAAVSSHPDITLGEMVRLVYADVDSALHALAGRSLLAHLEKLQAESRVILRDNRWRISDASDVSK
jgi:glyoxylase-like metal-dependent hydrolase (beta-lactamase superfamily II)